VNHHDRRQAAAPEPVGIWKLSQRVR
jgi:hypothetical protein